MFESLSNLIHPRHMPTWEIDLVVVSRIGLILVGGWLISTLLRRVIRLTIASLEANTECAEDRRRIQTLGRVFRYIASVMLSVVVAMLVLGELGVSIAPLLATAGVAGVAVGFGAQSLVKDYFTGFVMLIENQIRQGDLVEVGGKSGVVEEVTLRYVRLRDLEGAVHFVPNGAISTVSNRSRQFAYAVVDVPVAFGNDLDQTFAILRQAGQRLRNNPEWSERIIGDLELLGVDHLTEGSVVIRARIRAQALEYAAVRRALLKVMVEGLHQAGTRLPDGNTAGRPV
ncbi:MAG: mechanosensitive ion channel family protein [Betaproteobacteria bacterium]|nr:mechanosensitive ion channel family protein [Betaproteobacteria bacterium]